MFSYDPSLNIGKVRLRISDKYSDDYIFEDEEILSFLFDEDDNWRKAAALALETIATSEVYIQKVIKILNLSTDGAKVAAELRAQAKELRAQAAALATTDDDGLFDVAEWNIPPFNYGTIVINDRLRTGT